MIRFVLIRETYTGVNEARFKDLETLDVDCPELEEVLTRGGVGGGCNNDDYDRTELLGAEVRQEKS